MEPPSHTKKTPSGIPRPSRLPIAQSIGTRPSMTWSERQARASRKKASLPGIRPHQEKEESTDSTEIRASQDTAFQGHTPGRDRLSLADRTLETLSQIPPSPSPARRRSSFFQPQVPPTPLSRPGSSLARSRPSTSHGHRPSSAGIRASSRPASPEKRQLVPTSGNANLYRTPRKTDVKAVDLKSVPRPKSQMSTSSTRRRRIDGPGDSTEPNSAMPHESGERLGPKDGQTRKAPALQSSLVKNRTSLLRNAESRTSNSRAEASSSSFRKGALTTVIGHSDDRNQTKYGPTNRAHVRADESGSSSPKSSTALRATIAQAKARAARMKKIGVNRSSGADRLGGESWDNELGGNTSALRRRLQSARTDGRLNIAAMNLSELPREILAMYNADAFGSNSDAWYESVDLTRLSAADNKIEVLDEVFFPDVSPDQAFENEDLRASIFCGVETIDLHGNLLTTLPTGICHLSHLSTLNLSRNKLTSDSLGVLGPLTALRDLRLAENILDEGVETLLGSLRQLEVLDLRKCRIKDLSPEIKSMTNLRILNLSENLLRSLPTAELTSLPLVELDIARNRLEGIFIPVGLPQFDKLKSLEISHNALTSLASQRLRMPQLQNLQAVENRLEDLPDLSACEQLVTIGASGNKINTLPESLYQLQQLRNVDLSCNNIRMLDDKLGLLPSLTSFSVANNPLRERKFLTMNTDDLKSELRLRNESATTEDVHDESTAITGMTAKRGWDIRGGAVVRLSPQIKDVSTEELEQISQTALITSLTVSRHELTQIPASISTITENLTLLDLSHNRLAGNSYLSSILSLPKLRMLDLSHNAISSLEVLLESLAAPTLVELSLSRNRISSIPTLRPHFPKLTTLKASDNIIGDMAAASIQGLEYVDVSGNEISQLDPKIGLLGDHGLRTLLVGANRFRVPRRDVVDKGTGAILSWLKGRLPDGVTDV